MAKKKVSLTRSRAMKESWAKRRNSPMREAARKRTAKPKADVKPKFWILWAPSSHKPPKIRFGTLEKVRQVADIMVNKYRCDFYIMQSVELHTLTSKLEVVDFTGKPGKVEEPKDLKKPDFKTMETRTLAWMYGKDPDNTPYWWINYDRCPPPLAMQGQAWDSYQDNHLLQLWQRGFKDERILGERMGRSELAIDYRLEALCIRPRKSP